MTTRALPASLKLVRNAMRAAPAITTFSSSRVYADGDDVPANPQFPAYLLRRSGGIPEWYGDDRARIDINCYGRTRDEAESMAAAAFKFLMELPETDQVHDEGIVTGVQPASDLQELDDPTYRGVSKPTRYVFSIIAATHS